MADIQHVDIPDNQRHEAKGASTAIQHSVLVADGTGGTSFKKLKAENIAGLEGSGPVSVVGGQLVTSQNVYGTINKTATASSSLVAPSNGVSAQSGGMRVSRDGVYLITLQTGFSVSVFYSYPESAPAPSYSAIVNLPTFRNKTTNATLFTGLSGLVTLNTANVYEFDGISRWTVTQVA